MTLLHDASQQLFSRPADEHFESFEAIERSAIASKAHGQELTIPADNIIVLPGGEGEDRFSVQLKDGLTCSLNNYSLGQLSSGARVPLPLLERITPKTGAQVINESLRSGTGEVTDRMALLEMPGADDTDGKPRLRSLTSGSYFRVWDADILDEVKRWLLPVGYVPALPTINTNANQDNLMGNNSPALFRGDRDAFCFFYTEKAPDGDEFGGLRRGFMVKNSEVGAGAAEYVSLLFRDMCANFLIWDASNVQRRRQVHRGADNMRRFFLEMRATIQDLSVEIEGDEFRKLGAAAAAAFAGDGSPTDKNKAASAQRLHRQFRVPKSIATETVEAALLPVSQEGRPAKTPDLSHWTIAQGLTWEAKDSRYAGKLFELGRVGREVLEAVEV